MTQFIDDHLQEIQEAEALSHQGRENADQREACADKIEEIYDRLESLYKSTREEGEG